MAAPRYLSLAAGLRTFIAAAQTSASEVVVSTGTDGKISATFLPPGIGQDAISDAASEALAAGDFVNVHAAGTRKATATAYGTRAVGFVLALVAAAGTALVYLSGQNTAVTGKTKGAKQWLSNTVAGTSSEAAQTFTAGHIDQILGDAVSATNIMFTRSEPIVWQ